MCLHLGVTVHRGFLRTAGAGFELRNNGGFVPTLALIQSTPAVNRVPESFEDCGFGKLLILGTADLTDARGVPRPQDGTCDIGAFEIGPSFRIGEFARSRSPVRGRVRAP